MNKIFFASLVLLAACGGSRDPALSPTTDAGSVVTSTTSTTALPPESTTITSSTAAAATAPELTARCGAVELPVTDTPQLPDEPLDAEARQALAEATIAAGPEAGILIEYDWSIADRDEDRLVIFGVKDDDAGVHYADAVLVRTGDSWQPQAWGTCHIEASAPLYGNAIWVLDEEPSPDTTELSVLINERDRANGEPPTGREIRPVVVAEADSITITVLVEPVSGGADCPSNPWHPITIELGGPVGDRTLLDGSTIPPLERVHPPIDEYFKTTGGSSS